MRICDRCKECGEIHYLNFGNTFKGKELGWCAVEYDLCQKCLDILHIQIAKFIKGKK